MPHIIGGVFLTVNLVGGALAHIALVEMLLIIKYIGVIRGVAILTGYPEKI